MRGESVEADARAAIEAAPYDDAVRAVVELCEGLRAAFEAWHSRTDTVVRVHGFGTWTHEIRVRGGAILGEGCCFLTRAPGPRAKPYDRQGLVTGARLRRDGPDYIIRGLLEEYLESAGRPWLLVWPSFGHQYAYGPELLRNAARMEAQLRRLEQPDANRALVDQMLDAVPVMAPVYYQGRVARHVLRIEAGGITVSTDALLVWVPDRRVAVVSSRWIGRPFPRLIRDSLRDRIGARGIACVPAMPPPPFVYFGEPCDALRETWWESPPRLI